MKAATQRKIVRWLHIIASIPIIGYIYGPVKNIPNAVTAIKWVLFPLIVVSGLWLWKGHLVRKWLSGDRDLKRVSRHKHCGRYPQYIRPRDSRIHTGKIFVLNCLL